MPCLSLLAWRAGLCASTIRFLVAAALVAACFVAVSPAMAGIVIQVNTTEDVIDNDGDCSLREAIIAANTNSINDGCGSGSWSGADSIRFSLGAGFPVIHIGSDLPAITEQVTIAGNTGGATRVVLDGPGAGAGLQVEASAANSTLRQLVIVDFGWGVRIRGTGTRLVSNFIGTDASGSSASGNVIGVSVEALGVMIGGTSGVTPGGACTGECNLISGNEIGISVPSSSIAVIRGNFVGTDASGTYAIANIEGIRVEGNGLTTIGGAASGEGNLVSGNGTGIHLMVHSNLALGSSILGNRIGTNTAGTGSVPNVTGVHLDLDNSEYLVDIGGAADGEGNVVSGNTGNAIELIYADWVAIQGNLIGTALDGTTPLPNGGNGVHLDSSTHLNLIGGIGAGQGNVIASNAIGVRIGVSNYQNQIRGNSIHDNVDAGIVLEDAQNFAAYPPLVAGVDPVVGSTCEFCTVDVYSDSADEGEIYEASVVANDKGEWYYDGPVNGPNVTATSTTLAGSTSEFSEPVSLPEPGSSLALLVGASGLAVLRVRRRRHPRLG